MLAEPHNDKWKRLVNKRLMVLESQVKPEDKKFTLEMIGKEFYIPIRLKHEALKILRPDDYPDSVYPAQYDTYLTHPIDEKDTNYLLFTSDYYWTWRNIEFETFEDWVKK
jgi:hypothetical protein